MGGGRRVYEGMGGGGGCMKVWRGRRLHEVCEGCGV